MDENDEARVSLSKNGSPAAGASVPPAGPLPPDVPVPPGGPVPPVGPAYPGGPVPPAGPAYPGGPVPSTGPAYPGGPAYMAGPARPDTEAPIYAIVSGAAYVVLGLLGGVFGLLGSFAQDWEVGDVPVAAIILVALVFCMVRLAGLGMGGRLGATIPAVVWALVVFVMSVRRAEGDLVVPGTLAGYVYIIGGMVAAVAGVMLVPAARPPGDWLLGRAARTRG